MKSRLFWTLLTGICLALGFLIAVQVMQGIGQEEAAQAQGEALTQEDLNQTVRPVIFKSISEQNGRLRLSGTSEVNTVIIIQNRSENFRQIIADDNGNWSTVLEIRGQEALELGLLVYINQDVKIQSEEILYRIPAPPVAEEENAATVIDKDTPPLLMVTSPGGPTRIIQSPFRGLPTTGPISMGPVDYDNRGSVIFSGMSEAAGTVRIFARGELVGQSRVAVNGRWFFIAGETLPLGEYDIMAELTGANGNVSAVSVPFKRLRLKNSDLNITMPAQVVFGTDSWQIARDLYGGGRQYTAIFAPTETPEDTSGN